jgi:threonine efflux protein
MADFWAISSAVGVFLLACLSPGPVWAVITTTAIGSSRKLALFRGLGVAAATFSWAAIAMLGVGGLVGQFQWLQALLQIAGASYLVWMGARMLHSVWRRAPLVIDASSQLHGGGWDAVRSGYITSITNPKAAAFFGSIFVTMLPPEGSALLQIGTVLALTVASAAWHCALGVIFSTASVQKGHSGAKSKIDTILGVVFIGLGIRLVAAR